MSPVTVSPSQPMPATTLFSGYRGFPSQMTDAHFPPSIEQVRAGIMAYRSEKGYPTSQRYPHHEIEKSLEGEVFDADGKRFRIDRAMTQYIANAAAPYPIGDVEMHGRLLMGPLAAAVAAYPYVGKGTKEDAKAVKDKGDGAATQAMRAAFMRRWMRGEIRGGEGGGRDGMTRSGALYMGEKIGIGHGFEIDFLVDPLEVTNATKALDPTGAWGNVGHGWAPKLSDPAAWYPGYSGATSLMLAVNASQGHVRPLSDFLYLDKMQAPHRLSRYITAHGGSELPFSPAELVESASSALKIRVEELRAAALARPRHMNMMHGWIREGMIPTNIVTPSDGDALFGPALATGALHFAGLTGGVMEGIISTAVCIPMGVRTFLQFVSHDRLGEHEENADLTKPEHRFGFSEREYEQMLQTSLFDSQHIGHTLRSVRVDGTLATYIKNEAFAWFNRHIITEEEYNDFLSAYKKIVIDHDENVRFSDQQRALLAEALGRIGFKDVRQTHQFADFVPSRDWLVGIAAITPNKWSPLEGIRVDGNRLVVDMLVVGGSNAVYVLETHVEQL